MTEPAASPIGLAWTVADPTASDEDMLDRLRAGSRAAMAEVFRAYADPIYNYCYRRSGSATIAEDLTSSVFLEAWKSRRRAVALEGSVLPWLYGVATNVCRNHRRSLVMRAAKAYTRLHLADVEEARVDTSVVDQLDADRRLGRALDRLNQLPKGDQDVFVLVCWEELTYAEVAAALRIPIGTVRSRDSTGSGRRSASTTRRRAAMTDPWAKPPRRPLPEHLEDRILRELAEAPARRVRPRHLIAPLAAAALVAATAIGAASLNDGPLITPAETASPVPSTVRSTPAPTTDTSRTPTPTPKPEPDLDIRTMTRAEIRKDTKSCLKKTDPSDDLPRSGMRVVRYAAVQRRAGINGVTTEQVRTLLLEVGGNAWICTDGQSGGWSLGSLNPAAALHSQGPGGRDRQFRRIQLHLLK